MTKKRTSRAASLICGAVVVGAVAPPSEVLAQRRGGDSVDFNRPFSGQRPFQLDIHAGFTWSGVGFATGARFGIPIAQNGFASSINNAVYINFGVDFYGVRWRERCWNDAWDRRWCHEAVGARDYQRLLRDLRGLRSDPSGPRPRVERADIEAAARAADGTAGSSAP